jgi:hypothetical protein
MAEILTTGSKLTCPHGGSVQLSAGRTQLTIDGKPVLAKVDVMGKPVSGCSTVTNPQAGTKQCLTVASVLAGEAQLLSVGGMPALTTSAQGLTDGLAGGPVQWSVQSAGHTLLEGS